MRPPKRRKSVRGPQIPKRGPDAAHREKGKRLWLKLKRKESRKRHQERLKTCRMACRYLSEYRFIFKLTYSTLYKLILIG